jgi:hypothetical protein
MKYAAAHLIHLGLNCLNRRPVLTAMMVYSAGMGIMALMVFAVWGAPSRCSTYSSELQYVAQIPAGIASQRELTAPTVKVRNVYLTL